MPVWKAMTPRDVSGPKNSSIEGKKYVLNPTVRGSVLGDVFFTGFIVRIAGPQSHILDCCLPDYFI